MRKILLLILISFNSYSVILAQENNPKLQLAIDEGIILMDKKLYPEANVKFTYVIDNLKPLPNRLAFYFGKNSYFLKEYKQSINWLSKYIQLKGTSGTYYEEAKLYLSLAEKAYVANNKPTLSGIQENLENDFECYSQTKMICPACKGSGVIITRDLLSNKYKTCPFSGDDGYLSCEEYNLFMRGKLIESRKVKKTEEQ